MGANRWTTVVTTHFVIDVIGQQMANGDNDAYRYHPVNHIYQISNDIIGLNNMGGLLRVK